MNNILIDEKSRRMILSEEFSDILGQENVKKELKSALLMNRHIILVGSPGIGKTTLAKNVTKILPELHVFDCGFNCIPDNPICPICKSESSEDRKKKKIKKISGEERFVRIQGSPDLTAEDLLGDIDPIKAMKYGPLSIEAFTPGKIFKANNGILFFDEVNRCSEKLQNALLQVLEERRVTIGSYNIDFPAEFIFIGTMNPEDSSTETLSDVFLDRFDIIVMGYPETLEIEKQIISLKGKKIPEVEFKDELIEMMVKFIRDLRADQNIEKKPSVRSSIGIYERAQAYAFLSGHKNVTTEDIRNVMLSVLSHRIKLKPSIKYLETTEKYLEESFNRFKSKKSGYT
ncbi:TPA: AAA family ATPase [bacterium]|nr:AAA family ATPase [bacterium]